ncbi:MAG: leucine--tRNA ligase [Chlorobi bacterium]|nr:leucine--tRNA ligase [Chlorobiota bacterium]
MAQDFMHGEIDKKWQDWWEKEKIFHVTEDPSKQKFYVLDMFPYPSGAGLHVGHPLGYIATDVVARFKKMQGFNVLHPMGFDAFGLPAEQYAIQTGKHPAETTKENIARYKQQMKKIGLVYDWDREVITSDPKYYKWTQWIFLKMYKSWYNKKTDKAEPIETLVGHLEKHGTEGLDAWTSGWEISELTPEQWQNMTLAEKEEFLMHFRLAFLDEAEVNWCPALGTVLANEEVVWDEEKGLVSERGGFPVERRPLKQWFLRITAYAERLLKGLEEIDWRESIKEMQRHWIGKSEGALINFPIENRSESIKVFTTRPDTIFGVTFMVLAPEHPLALEITTEDRKKEVEEFINRIKNQPEIERLSEKDMKGIFTGAYAIHPFTGEKLPIWLGDYVLMHYGTGAIMAVPGHDKRDWKFAKKYGLPIKKVIDAPGVDVEKEAYEEKEGVLVNSDFLNGLTVPEAIEKAIQEIEKRGLGKRHIQYRMRDFLFSRQRYWGEPIPIVYRNIDGKWIPFPVDESQLPIELPYMEDFKPTGSPEPPLARLKDWVELPDGSRRETNTMPGWAGSNWYYLRYMDPHNDQLPVSPEKERYWGPVDLYVGGAEHATAHLIYARFVNKFLKDIGIVTHEEPFQKLFNQGMIQGQTHFIWVDWDEKKAYSSGKVESLPEEVRKRLLKVRFPIKYVDQHGNVDLSRIEEMKREFVQFKDLEFIPDDDGIFRFAEKAIEKMSKSYLNVLNPDDVIEQYGADAFRVYEMFLGPLDEHKPWDTRGIMGAYRFVRNIWNWYVDKEGKPILTDEQPTEEELKIIHKAIDRVTRDIESLAMNTAISTLMTTFNEIKRLGTHKKSILEPFLKLLSPFAPHIAEEIWHLWGNKDSIFNAPWPQAEEKYLKEDTVEYPVAINGKKRFVLQLPTSWSREQIEEFVLNHEKTKKYTEGKEIKKIIVVPGKIVNIVVK